MMNTRAAFVALLSTEKPYATVHSGHLSACRPAPGDRQLASQSANLTYESACTPNIHLLPFVQCIRLHACQHRFLVRYFISVFFCFTSIISAPSLLTLSVSREVGSEIQETAYRVTPAAGQISCKEVTVPGWTSGTKRVGKTISLSWYCFLMSSMRFRENCLNCVPGRAKNNRSNFSFHSDASGLLRHELNAGPIYSISNKVSPYNRQNTTARSTVRVKGLMHMSLNSCLIRKFLESALTLMPLSHLCVSWCWKLQI